MKKEIEVFDYAGEILSKLQRGILLTTKANDRVNSMVIGWGTLGIDWNTPTITVFVREGRFTRELLDANPEFTINVPKDRLDPKILATCGTKSGRDLDKVKEADLTLVEPSVISVPAIAEAPLTLECRVLYRQKQDVSALSEEMQQRFYPQDVPGSFHGSNRDPHVTYRAQIVASYIVE